MTTPAILLRAWLATAASAEGLAWLDAQCQAIAAGGERALYLAMGQAGRRLGRAALPADRAAASAARPGWDASGWSADQAGRTLLLLALPDGDPVRWQTILDRLFHAGTIEELVALYQALPLLPHQDLLAARAAEGVRSSMQPVFAAVALANPVPAERLDDPAWNQLVLKCFFTAADVGRVVGLHARLNPELGRMLADYARERRAAGRSLDPRLPPLARACGSDCKD